MLNIIVATDKQYGIAKNGTIPWNYSSDIKYFANATKKTIDPTKKNVVQY